MKRTVHLVHGFNVSDGGSRTTDKLVPYFERAGFFTLQHDYGWTGLLGAYFCNTEIATRTANAVGEGDIGCGHSNGCAILVRAAEAGARFAGLIFINPALDSDIKIPPQVQWINVYWNKDDYAVKIAQWIPFNKYWGDMGARGYTGADPRFHNVNAGVGLYPAYGHSDIFSKLQFWGPTIANRAARQFQPLKGKT